MPPKKRKITSSADQEPYAGKEPVSIEGLTLSVPERDFSHCSLRQWDAYTTSLKKSNILPQWKKCPEEMDDSDAESSDDEEDAKVNWSRSRTSLNPWLTPGMWKRHSLSGMDVSKIFHSTGVLELWRAARFYGFEISSASLKVGMGPKENRMTPTVNITKLDKVAKTVWFPGTQINKLSGGSNSGSPPAPVHEWNSQQLKEVSKVIGGVGVCTERVYSGVYEWNHASWLPIQIISGPSQLKVKTKEADGDKTNNKSKKKAVETSKMLLLYRVIPMDQFLSTYGSPSRLNESPITFYIHNSKVSEIWCATKERCCIILNESDSESWSVTQHRPLPQHLLHTSRLKSFLPPSIPMQTNRYSMQDEPNSIRDVLSSVPQMK